jgi:ABC-2 type transport system permease protein
MSLATAPATGEGGRVTAVKRPYRFIDVVRSEWTKFKSVHSTYWTFLVAIVLGIGLSALVSGISASHYQSDPGVRFGWDPTQRSIRPEWFLAQLAFAVLGVLTVTSEYSSGMIRTSLAAVPRRMRMMSAKLLVFGVAALAVGEVISVIAFSLGQALIHGKAPSASFGQHDVLRVVLGSGVYLLLIGLLGSAFALIVRHAAAGIALVVGMLFILPGIAEALPTSWSQPIEKYWPTNAGQRLLFLHADRNMLGPWLGFGLLALFVAVVAALAFFLLQRRDA